MDENRHAERSRPGGVLWLVKWLLVAALVAGLLLLVGSGGTEVSIV